jgi:SAM-dependent methyltransferase
MIRKTLPQPRKKSATPAKKAPQKAFKQLVENDLFRRVSAEEFRDKVRDVYDGPKGAMLAAASLVSLHLPLGERLFRTRQFDLRGVGSVLDVGSGAGQLAKHVLKYAEPGTQITCVDLSFEMLCRARNRIRSAVPSHLAADLAHLPFADGSFDCITCGYVLEHLPDARVGLTEMARVLVPGGRMLLLVTEDSYSGAFTSRFWCCRTHNRKELRKTCRELGLHWKKELWFTRMHKLLRAGGICVEIEKR